MEQGKSVKANFTWNMIGSVFESALSFVLLIAVNRIMGESAGGIFTLAFSHAQLMYYIGTLEVRPIQSTDVKQKYPFSSYLSLRCASCVLMIIVCLAYALAMDADPLKKRVVMYVCLYKTAEALIDSFTAMYQQHDRIEYSGKISVFRVSLTLAVFIGTLMITRELEYACIAMVLAGLATLLTINRRFLLKFPDAVIRTDFTHAKEILISCFPLFISVFVMLYISNAPKYAIDTYCTDVIQNRYSILFMPAFVINLFSQFVLRPMLTTMARLWTDRRTEKFARNIMKMTAGLAAVTLLGLAGAWLLGIPILKMLYNIDLERDKSVLLLVMVYGGLNAVNIFLYDMIAVTRRQKWLLIGYAAAALTIFFLAPAMVKQSQMTGAILSSIISIGFLDVILAAILTIVIRNRFREEGQSDGGKTGNCPKDPERTENGCI